MATELNSLERLVPGDVDPADRAGQETLDLHLQRYEFAARHARPGHLLDMACGVGYGTSLVAQRRGDVDAIGVDVCAEAVQQASTLYGGPLVRYECADAMVFRGSAPFDTIVSLETIEHLPEPRVFFAHLVALLAPGGVLVASVPTTPSVDLNPHHLHDFSARDLREMGSAQGLDEIDSFVQVQRVNPFEFFGERRFGHGNLRANLPAYYASHPVALLRRIATTLSHGFANHYLTIAWRRGS